MPILPNIFPNAAADLVRIGEAKTSHEAFGKTDEPFDHLMTRALSPFSSKEISPVAEENPPTKIIVPDMGKRNVFLNKSAQSFSTLTKIIENPNQVGIDSDDFPLQSKNLKSSTQATNKNPLKTVSGNLDAIKNSAALPEVSIVTVNSEKVLAQPAPIAAADQKPRENQTKTTDGNSDLVVNSSTPSEIKVAAVIPENILIPILTPTIVTPDKKNELSAKATADVSVIALKTVVAGKSAGISAAPSEAKKISAAVPTVSNSAVSENQPGVEINSIVKTDKQGKIATAVEALAVEKTDSVDSKKINLAVTSPPVLPLTKNVINDSTMAKVVVEPIDQSPQTELSGSPDLSAKSAAQKESDVNGTPVAKQEVPMSKTEITDKTISSTGKNLPGAAVSDAPENKLPTREIFSALARTGQIAANVTVNSSVPNNATDVAPLSPDATNPIGSANLADVRSRPLERVQDMVVLHATRLSESGNDLLQVVIKPGAGTQLSLELRQRGDGVEATATLQRGDFEHLNQQWPALQQQLEQRGIKLAPLVADGNFAGSGENNFQQKQNQFAESDSFPTFAEVAPVGSFAQLTARAGAHRGWESWA